KKDKKHQPRPIVRMERTPSFHFTMDAVLAGIVLLVAVIFAFLLFSTIVNTLGAVEAGYFAAFGIPLVIACFYLGRPLRFGGAIAAVLLVSALFAQSRRGGKVLYSDRSYFGIIRVQEANHYMPSKTGKKVFRDSPLLFDLFDATSLLHGNIDHGMNFRKTSPSTDGKSGPRDNWEGDYSRLPTTYYHRLG